MRVGRKVRIWLGWSLLNIMSISIYIWIFIIFNKLYVDETPDTTLSLKLPPASDFTST